MEKKQTAVEWLFENINDALIQFSEGKISASVYGIRATEYKFKAKEMEKEQIEKAIDECRHNYKHSDNYYNATMTPNEKAAQLVVDYQLKVRSLDYKEAVACAIVTVEEIIKAMRKGVPEVGYGTGYWSEVKQEIEKL